MGRSIAALLVMLVAFAVLGAVFIALDSAAGLRTNLPTLFAAGTARTSTPTPTRIALTSAPSSTATPGSATPSAVTTASITGTPTTPVTQSTATPAQPTATPSPSPFPTPPGGVTPPRYGTLLDYANNTSFSPTFMQSIDSRIIALTNDERVAHGLSKLSENEALDVIAASRSQDMVKRGYFDHFDPTGPVDAQGRHAAAVQELLSRNDVTYAEVGENLVGNTGLPLDARTPRQVVQAWMNHPEHRANILHASYTMIGVGLAAENQAGGLRVVITQIFTS